MSDGINDSHIQPDREYLPGVKRFRLQLKTGGNFESLVLEQEASECVSVLLGACEQVIEICEDGDAVADFERVVKAMTRCAEVMERFKCGGQPMSYPGNPISQQAVEEKICLCRHWFPNHEDREKCPIHCPSVRPAGHNYWNGGTCTWQRDPVWWSQKPYEEAS